MLEIYNRLAYATDEQLEELDIVARKHGYTFVGADYDGLAQRYTDAHGGILDLFRVPENPAQVLDRELTENERCWY